VDDGHINWLTSDFLRGVIEVFVPLINYQLFGQPTDSIFNGQADCLTPNMGPIVCIETSKSTSKRFEGGTDRLSQDLGK
jgi:hypothetical protein